MRREARFSKAMSEKESFGFMAQENETAKEAQETAAAEKKLTKYDLKIQRREEERKKAERDEKIFSIVGVCVIIALVALIASFPIRSYLAVHGTVLTLDGEPVSRVEFDYYYNSVKTNYLNNYGYYLQYYYGMDMNGDMKDIMYDDTLSFHDFFEQSAVEQLRQNAALRKEIAAVGFTHDVTQDYADYIDALGSAIKESGQTVKAYYQSNFGPYATEARLEQTVKNSLLVTAYYDEKNAGFLPTDGEIDTYYAEHTDDYDFVDYRMTTVSAQIPTEPTELADEGAVVGEDGSYTASEAEIEKAMADAAAEADEAVKTVDTDGTLYEGRTKIQSNSYVSDWLFEEGRKEGDTTVASSDVSHSYYAAEFLNRYQDTKPTYNVRLIATQEDNGEAILAEYRAAGGTEDAFIETVKKYSGSGLGDGLREGVSADSYGDAAKEWLESGPAAGDTFSTFVEDYGVTYVLYYVGTGRPSWYYTIRDTIQSDRMTEYLDGITEQVELQDPKGNLEYLKKLAEKEEPVIEPATEEESAG